MDNTFKKENDKVDKYMLYKYKLWQTLATNLHENSNYLYDCNIPLYLHKKISLSDSSYIDQSHFVWSNVWLWCSLTCILVAVTTYKNKLLSKVHPSQLIGAMSIMFLMTNWHIFMWKLGEVEIVCYIGIDGWLQGLVRHLGGHIT